MAGKRARAEAKLIYDFNAVPSDGDVVKACLAHKLPQFDLFFAGLGEQDQKAFYAYCLKQKNSERIMDMIATLVHQFKGIKDGKTIPPPKTKFSQGLGLCFPRVGKTELSQGLGMGNSTRNKGFPTGNHFPNPWENLVFPTLGKHSPNPWENIRIGRSLPTPSLTKGRRLARPT